MKSPLWIALACLGSLAALATTAWTKLERSKRPPIGPPPAVETPKIERRTLTNGLQVWIVARRELPIVNASLLIRAGSCQDGQQAGLAAMTASLLDEGTPARPAVAFTNAVEDLGATLSAAASEEQTTVALQTLTKHLDAALGLMGEMVVHPAFSAEELERERKSRLQSLRQQRDQPGTIATRVFNQVVYGEDHPYGRPASGTSWSVEGITRDQIRDFYRSYYRPNNAVLIVVGDVSDAELAPLLERAFAGWLQNLVSDDALAIPPRPPDRPVAVTLIDKPGAAQSEVRIGHAGAARTTSPDYYALQVLNALLGGQFNSRINLNLREAKGYTYGARSSLGFRRGDGPFVASAGVFTAKTDSSLIEFLRELEDIRASRPATREETELAKNQLIRSYPRRLETNEGVATALMELALYGLPDAEITDYLTRIGRVTPQEVTRVAEQYIAPDHLEIVVVGDLAKIQPGIEALRLGPVSVRDADGKEAAR